MIRALLPVYLVLLVDVLASTLLTPIVPTYVERFGATALAITALGPTFLVLSLLSGPYLGTLSDTWGRKPVLVISQVGTLVGFVLMATARSLGPIFAARALDGLTAGNAIVVFAYIADVTAPDERARAFGGVSVLVSAAWFIGPAVAAWLVPYGLAAPIWAAAALSLLSIVATALLIPSRSGPRPAAATSRRSRHAMTAILAIIGRRHLRWPLTLQVTTDLAMAMFYAGYILVLERRFHVNGHLFTARDCGLICAYSGVVAAVTQLFLMRRLLRRLGTRRAMTLALAILSAGIGLFAGAASLPLLVVATTCQTVGTSLFGPALRAVLSGHADETEQGAMMASTQTLTGVTSVVGSLFAGWMVDGDHLVLWAVVPALLCLAGLIGSARTLTSAPPQGSTPA